MICGHQESLLSPEEEKEGIALSGFFGPIRRGLPASTPRDPEASRVPDRPTTTTLPP